MGSHRFTEPRVCRRCDEYALEPHDLVCPFCTGETIAISDYEEAAWHAQQEDNASEPPVTADEMHAAAWAEREALRGRVWL